MCLIAFALNTAPGYRLLVAANRDESHARPTRAAARWDDAPAVFAGRDLRDGGTWMGVSADGRFAALTNHRDGVPPGGAARSRGHLVAGFLRGADPAANFAVQVDAMRAEFSGFHLLLGDRGGLWYVASDQMPIRVAAGVHSLSNARLDTPWPKARGLASDLARAVGSAENEDALFTRLFAALAQRAPAADADLPDTGIGRERERALSARMIVNADYGTRSATVLAQRDDGSTRFEELSFDGAGAPVGRVATVVG
jgi:uncharacterized protein with NRDE domain